MTERLHTVIIDSHIAAGEPILRAVRDKPDEPGETGWYFLHSLEDPTSMDENCEVRRLWEILEIEPTLAPFMDLPPGSVLVRSDGNLDWKRVH